VGLVADAYAFLPWWIPDWLDCSTGSHGRTRSPRSISSTFARNLLDASNLLEEAALDRYAFVRDAYFQRRRNLVYDGNPPPATGADKSSAAPIELDTEPAREPAAPAPL